MTPLQRFFVDFQDVAGWFQGLVNKLFNTIIRKNDWNFIFYTAMLPAFLMLCFDIIMSIICSIRLRELRFFNVLSPRSWALFRSSSASVANNLRDYSLKYSRFSGFFNYLRLYKTIKTNDIVRCKDGMRFVYLGAKQLYDSQMYHVYRSSNGSIYYSSMKPGKWSRSSGHSRMASVVLSRKKSK